MISHPLLVQRLKAYTGLGKFWTGRERKGRNIWRAG